VDREAESPPPAATCVAAVKSRHLHRAGDRVPVAVAELADLVGAQASTVPFDFSASM